MIRVVIERMTILQVHLIQNMGGSDDTRLVARD